VSNITLLERAASNFATTAIFQGKDSWTYGDILEESGRIAAALLGGSDDLCEQRVAFLLSPGFCYVAVQWAIWRAGGVAMPLSLSATEPELEHYLSDAGAVILVTEASLHPRVETLCERLNIVLLLAADMTGSRPGELPTISEDRRAMMLYTSGTTSKPKGVVATHRNIEAQVRMLVEAWQWRADDRIPLFLPLHHVHGIVNVMSCALWSGASIEVLTRCKARYTGKLELVYDADNFEDGLEAHMSTHSHTRKTFALITVLALMTACSPELKKKFKFDSFSDLDGRTLIVHENRPHSWENWASALHIPPPKAGKVYRFDSMAAVVQAAAQGHGVAIVSWPLCQSWFTSGALVRALQDKVKTEEKFHVAYRPEENEREEVTRLIEWIVEKFKSDE